jgi:hypothetical protein
MVERPEVFDHAGLLVNEPPSKPGCPLSSRPMSSAHLFVELTCSLTQVNHSSSIILFWAQIARALLLLTMLQITTHDNPPSMTNVRARRLAGHVGRLPASAEQAVQFPCDHSVAFAGSGFHPLPVEDGHPAPMVPDQPGGLEAARRRG